jgi:hypothetical protein
MTGKQVNPHDLAKLGNCKAIDFLMNRQLNAHGITAKSKSQNGCLQVTLESKEIPSQTQLTPFIIKGIKNLGVNVFSEIEI